MYWSARSGGSRPEPVAATPWGSTTWAGTSPTPPTRTGSGSPGPDRPPLCVRTGGCCRSPTDHEGRTDDDDSNLRTDLGTDLGGHGRAARPVQGRAAHRDHRRAGGGAVYRSPPVCTAGRGGRAG